MKVRQKEPTQGKTKDEIVPRWLKRRGGGGGGTGCVYFLLKRQISVKKRQSDFPIPKLNKLIKILLSLAILQITFANFIL